MKKLLFLTLNTFSATGGIEKVCRAAGKALHEIAVEHGGELAVYSMHDSPGSTDQNYFPSSIFRGFGSNRLKFTASSVAKGRSAECIVLSHINLLPVGFLIKKFSPKTKLVLLAHGIEVWEKFSGFKKKMLADVDLFLAVSSFTAAKLQSQHNIITEKVKVLHNCLDPFLQKSAQPILEADMQRRYGIDVNDFVLLTVTRLKFSEQYKGYDKVIEVLQAVKKTIPGIKYMVAGKYDEAEKARLDAMVFENGLNDTVVFTGFVKDEELNAHFNIADAYIMPSTGEGFGIVFIEALFYGLPVIAGNMDGSVDALDNGYFGQLVNPNRGEEIVDAIKKIAKNKVAFRVDQRKLIAKFGFEAYKAKWKHILSSDTATSAFDRGRKSLSAIKPV